MAAVSFDDTMPTRKLSPAEENEARKAFAMLQNKKLLTVNKRGRPASMAPVHAALAIRKGAFAKNRGASLSAESQLTPDGRCDGVRRPAGQEDQGVPRPARPV